MPRAAHRHPLVRVPDPIEIANDIASVVRGVKMYVGCILGCADTAHKRLM